MIVGLTLEGAIRQKGLPKDVTIADILSMLEDKDRYVSQVLHKMRQLAKECGRWTSPACNDRPRKRFAEPSAHYCAAAADRSIAFSLVKSCSIGFRSGL